MARELKWHTEKRKVNDLIPFEKNPRKISKEQAGQLKKSLEKFNLVELPAIDVDNKIIAGHQRIKILQMLGRGDEEIEVRVPNRKLTEKEFIEYNLRSNKNVGEWDFEALKNFDSDLLKDVGFDSIELDKIFTFETHEDDFDVDIELEKIEKPKTKLGDLYICGEHKLLCGDATKEENWRRLMNNEKADMVFTDPPYGVNYGAKNRFLNSFQRAGRKLEDIPNDTFGKDKLFNMLVKVFTLANSFGQNYCSYYVTAPQGGELGLMMMMMMSGLPVKHVLIWVKNAPTFSLGRLDYEYQHEPILFTWKKTHKFYSNGSFKTSIWTIDKPRKSDLHPTMKPISLVVNALLNSTKQGDIVVDCFGGSGSTLIACEQSKRKCRMMELSPNYCDVIIKRWEDFTKMKAKKLC